MNKKEIVKKTVEYVKASLAGAEGGHDWWHAYRVWQLSKKIAATEQVDLLVVELGALLHDIADSKFHNGDEEIGPKKAKKFMLSIGVKNEIVEHVVKIIRNISFKGGLHVQEFKSKELDVVQDADRLDALGAIGIAKNFSMGGYKGRAIYNPEIKPNLTMTAEEYKKNNSSTINHFYEKTLLLKDRMNTKIAKRMAVRRHKYMEKFLEEFYLEWEGN
ncbi:MAG: HD domain-containing protein [Candidatus Falkowbacteria bacterium]